jgi:hypothetical protein
VKTKNQIEELSLEASESFNRPQSCYFSTPRISSLTQVENEKMMLTSTKFNSKSPSSSNIFYYFPQQSCDFNSLLKSIDSIASGRPSLTTKVLSEGRVLTLNLKNGQIQSFKIFSKGKRSPLKVNLRRNYGKSSVFISKTCENPTAETCDRIFLDDNFEVHEKNTFFSCDSLFLAVEAQGPLVLTIGISFGYIKNIYLPPEELPQKKKTLSAQYEEIYKNEGKRLELKKKVENLVKNRKNVLKKQANSKNFILINRNSSTIMPVKSFPNLEEKIAGVLKRRAEIYIEKKIHNLESLKQKTSKNQSILARTEQKLRISQLIRIQKTWLTLLLFQKAAAAIRSKILTEKSDLIFNLHQSASARLIQKVFKTKYLKISVKDNILLHARNDLFLFNSTFYIIKKNIKKSFISFCIQSAKETHVRVKFDQFLKKVTLIQKASKSFLTRNKRRIEEITKIWNNVFSSMILRKSSAVSIKYLKIPPIVRDQIVKKFYEEKFSSYLKSVEKSESLYRVPKEKPQEFKYLPSPAEIKVLIEKAAEEIEKNEGVRDSQIL